MIPEQLVEEYAQENNRQREHIRRLHARIVALEEALRLFAQDDGLAVLDEEAYRQARALLEGVTA